MKNDTSFKPGERKAGRQQGTKNKKTMLKESIGIDTWQQVENYLVTEGAEKLIDSMRQLKPGQFVYAYTGLLEYFRPKLSRQQLTAGTPGDEQEIVITMNISD